MNGSTRSIVQGTSREERHSTSRRFPSREETSVSARDAQPVLMMGSVAVDLRAYRVSRADPGGSTTWIHLTPTEWRVLELLMHNPGRLVTKRLLLITVWGRGCERENGYLRLYLCQLRKKLEPEPSHPRYLITEHGMGYRFVPDPIERSRSPGKGSLARRILGRHVFSQLRNP
jgi:DNA-binding response OmpR family regulator